MLVQGYGAKQANMGARAFGNLHEQSIVFLVSLWVHALFEDVDGAAKLGSVYLGLRALYPVVWTLCGGFDMKILVTTMPQYGIILWMLGTTVAKASFGTDLKALAMGSDAVGCAAMTALFFAQFNIDCMVIHPICAGFFSEEKTKGK